MTGTRVKRIIFIVFLILSGMPLCATTNTPGTDEFGYLDGFSLREIYKEGYRQLDEVCELLQYGAQIISKGSFVVHDKAKALGWIREHIGILRSLNNADESNSKDLHRILRTVKSFTAHYSKVIESKFEYTSVFEIPTLRSVELSEAAINVSLDSNALDIDKLQVQVNNAGLTKLNRFARAVDYWNDKLHITDVLQQAPSIASFVYMGLVLTPYEWLIWKKTEQLPGTGVHREQEYSVPLLGKLKKLVGPRQPTEAEKAKKPTTIHDWFGSDDYKGVKEFGKLAFAWKADDWLQAGINKLKPSIRTYWNGLKGIDVSRNETYRYTTITLDNPRLIGLKKQIGEMKKVVNYIYNPERYDRANCQLEKAILLTGPSRSGKTLLAEALCGTLNEMQRKKGDQKKFKFRQIKTTDVRWTQDGIKGIINEAKEHAPVVLFLDEIHNYPLQTKEGGTATDTLNEFLTIADALKGEQVIVIGATNRAHLLDDALLKPGRFGNIIHFEEPTFNDRKEYFEVYFKESALRVNEFDLDSLARQTNGASYGELYSLFRGARFEALDARRTVTQSDFENVLRRQIYRLELDKTLPLNPEEIKLVAAHQAGHALMYLLYETQIQEIPEIVTIRGKWRKIVELRHFEATHSHFPKKKNKIKYGHTLVSKKSEILNIPTNPLISAKIKLAGHCAEKILLGNTTYSYHEKDKQKALGYLEKIAFEGLKKEDYTKEEQEERKKFALETLKTCEKETIDILLAHKEDLIKIAAALEHEQLLTAQDLKMIVKQNQQGQQQAATEAA